MMSGPLTTPQPTPGTSSDDVSVDETVSLIAASKVNGTSVINRDGEMLGSIYDVMINKRSGRVDYAIMSFGGFLGMAEHYHPLPWSVLQYDPRAGGYVVDIDRNRLQGAPSYVAGLTPDLSGPYGQEVDQYYGIPGRTIR